MGSVLPAQGGRQGGRQPGKIDALLDERLQGVEWGEYRLGDLFEKIYTKKLSYKADDLPKQPTGDFVLPCLTSSFQNQGLNYYAPKGDATILSNVISLPSNSDVYRAYYQSREFTILSDAYAIRWKHDKDEISHNQYLFMVMCINKVTDLPIYSYKNKLGGWNVVKEKYIGLPTKDGKIDFDFMESFIRELEEERIRELAAYLKVSGLDNYELSNSESKALADFETLDWAKYNLENLFGKSTRGKRLKSADRISGTLPFVTAGEACEGISAFIANDVDVFESNTTTIDMFGSAKYRNFRYGADDHVAVVHTENLPKNAAIFVTTAIHKAAHTGKFDYSRNFYPKDADELDISLPSKDGKPDFSAMATLISAVQKLVIKNVALYADRKIEATKTVAAGNGE